jgi:hypothetical protein
MGLTDLEETFAPFCACNFAAAVDAVGRFPRGIPIRAALLAAAAAVSAFFAG